MAVAFSPDDRNRSLTDEGCRNIAGAALLVERPERAVAMLERFWQLFFQRPATRPIGAFSWGCDVLAAVTPYLALGYSQPGVPHSFAPSTPALPVTEGSPVSLTSLAGFLASTGNDTIRPDVLLYAFHLRQVSMANEAIWAKLPECTRIDIGHYQLFRGLDTVGGPVDTKFGRDRSYVTYRHPVCDMGISPSWMMPDDMVDFLHRCPQSAPPAAPLVGTFGERHAVFSHELATYAPARGFVAPSPFATVATRSDIPSPPIELWAEALNPLSSLGTTLRVVSHLLNMAEQRGPLNFYGSIPYKLYYSGDYRDTSADYGPNVTVGYQLTTDDIQDSLVSLLTDDTLYDDTRRNERSIRMQATAGGKPGHIPFTQLLADRYFLPAPLCRAHFELTSQDGEPVPPVASNVFSHETFRSGLGGNDSVTVDQRYAALPPRALPAAGSVEEAVSPAGDYRVTATQLASWFTAMYPSGGQPSKIFDDHGSLVILRRNSVYRYDPAEQRIRPIMPVGLTVCDWGDYAPCYNVFGRRIFFPKTIDNAGDDGSAMGHAGLPGGVFAEHVRKQGLLLVYDVDSGKWYRVPFSAASGHCDSGVQILGLGLGRDHDNMSLQGNVVTLKCYNEQVSIDLTQRLTEVTGPTLSELPYQWVW
jgi:hypothetical protein